MSDQPKLVLHKVPFSHPCLAVEAVLDRHGLEYETVEMVSGTHGDKVEEVYGEGNRTVPGLLVDDEPVHGTTAIFEKLDELVDDADLYPGAVAAAIREAERGVAEDLAKLPEQLDIVDELIEGGVVGGDEPTAVDYQIGSSLRLLSQIGDVRPLIEGRPAEKLVDAWFERGPADIPAGAFHAGWVPERSATIAA